jgi:D-serine deaminase-like pyridoxal phosphate-dependent protein
MSFTIDYSNIFSPGIILFPERVAHNIDWIINRVGGRPERLRPHIKTHKTKEANEMMLQKGIKKFKCATIAEAELLALSNAPDVLIAYQLSLSNLNRFKLLIEKYPKTNFSCLVDDFNHLIEMDQFALNHGIKIPVFIDLNLGMNRTGIQIKDGLNLIKQIIQSSNIEFRGIHAYDGHIRDKKIEERIIHVEEDFEDFWTLKEKIDVFCPDIEYIVGGTPSFLVHSENNEFTCSPGTFIFFDAGYAELYPENSLKQAVYIVTRVVSKPTKTSLCLDLGHKSIAAENPIQNRIRFVDSRILSLESQSEEHGIVKVENSEEFKIGDIILGIPYHVCPTIALHQFLQVIENGKLSGEWEVLARNRKITI